MNTVILVGVSDAPPVTRDVGTWQVCGLRVKTVRSWQGKTYNDWHDVVAWGDLVQIAQQCTPGKGVLAIGRLSTRSYDKDGEKRYRTEVVASQLVQCAPPVERGAKPQAQAQAARNDGADEVPF